MNDSFSGSSTSSSTSSNINTININNSNSNSSIRLIGNENRTLFSSSSSSSSSSGVVSDVRISDCVRYQTGYVEGDDEEFLIKLDGWWGRVHRLYRISGRSIEDLKQALLNDVQAWGIISALVMTMGVGLLSVGSNNVYDPTLSSNNGVLTLFVCFTVLSSLSALNAIVFASNDYVFWNAIPADHVPRAMIWRYSNVAQWERFFLWMVASWIFLYAGLIALIKVSYGNSTFYVALCFGSILLFYGILNNFYLLGKNIGYYDKVYKSFQRP